MLSKISKFNPITITIILIVGFILITTKEVSAQQAVVVVGAPATEVVTNTLKNTANLLANSLSSANLEALVLKEFTLDSLARNMAQQLQQQLVSDTLKMLGGQMPGQNGEIPFIQNYADHYKEISDKAAGDVIFNSEITDQCSEEQAHVIRQAALEAYRKQSGISDGSSGTGGTQNQCTLNQTEGRRSLDVILSTYDKCGADQVCASLEVKKDVSTAVANAIDESKTKNVNGYKPIEACKTVSTATGQKEDCKITTPASLISHSVDFNIGELPAQMLLNVDEFNEIVSSFMSNLTNQAITSITGVLGLSGNSDYSSNVFGPNGNLSYADALAQDDIAQYQSNQKNPIEDAIKNENKYRELQNIILGEITALETKLAANESDFPGCFDLELSDELKQIKSDTLNNLNISSTTSAILSLLNTQYNNATDAAVKNAILSTFIEYENQGYFRTQIQNQDLELSFINYELDRLVDLFKYDTAVAKADCGGEFDYDGNLTQGGTDTSTNGN